jgi:hypothetical protein
MAVLFLSFWRISILISILIAPVYIPTSSGRRLHFLCVLTSICCCLFSWQLPIWLWWKAYDPAITLLGVCPKEYKSTLISAYLHIAALFTITKLWNQPKYPTTDEWIKKIIYMYHEILFRHKKWNYVICRKMGGTDNHHVEWDKPGSKGICCMFSLICEP